MTLLGQLRKSNGVWGFKSILSTALLLCDNLKNTVGKGGCYFSMFICLDGADGGEEDWEFKCPHRPERRVGFVCGHGPLNQLSERRKSACRCRVVDLMTKEYRDSSLIGSFLSEIWRRKGYYLWVGKSRLRCVCIMKKFRDFGWVGWLVSFLFFLPLEVL